MISLEQVFLEVRTLEPAALERWIAAEWVRPDGGPGAYRFETIDIARIRLILELQEVFEVSEPAMPAVLSLIDQIYDLRRRMRRLNQAMEAVLPSAQLGALLRHLEG